MALSTFSVFYLPFVIDSTNNKINFDEGGGELSATLDTGSFSLNDILLRIKTAMDAAGGDTYTVSVDRTTRIITISSTGTFSLLLGTGTQVGVSPFELLGFTSGVDTSTAASQVGDTGAGEEYTPQFILQDYVAEGDFEERIQPNINESASGVIEVISFGVRKFIEGTLRFTTDLPQDGHVIRSNPTGRADLINFLRKTTTKDPFEFMPDRDTRTTFFKVIIESTPSNRDGVGYRLRELVTQNLPGYYDIGPIRFRILEN